MSVTAALGFRAADVPAGLKSSGDPDVAIVVNDGPSDAAQVVVEGTGESVALDGVEFVVGEEVLVTAVDGMVQTCGVSGAASEELEQLYTEWYG